jgi:NTE family protein
VHTIRHGPDCEGEAAVFDSFFRSKSAPERAPDQHAGSTPGEPHAAAPRPTIGLALGGGAARGFAHIGVLRTLVEHGIKPDIIVGTSIGAVVGGCYAAGHLDTLEQWARSLSRRGVLGYLDISLSGSGLIGGSRLASTLEKSLGNTLIEELPLRFAAIATEVKTGHEIWLTHGRLVEALRASYALPGIFAPVPMAGRWLVDGALVNPVPVSAARALGARLVIAVNLNADLFGRSSTIVNFGSDDSASPLPDDKVRKGTTPERSLKKEFLGAGTRPGLTTVMIEAFNVMQDRITRARLAGDPPDVSVSPHIGRVGWFDFHRAEEAIQMGADAAEKAIETISESVAALS